MTNPAKIQSHLPAIVLFIILFQNVSFGQTSYTLQAKCIDRSDEFLKNELSLQTDFTSRLACIEYVNKLPSLLQSKGFVTFSIDSVLFDTASAKLVLYLGQQYKWAHINVSAADPEILALTGWNNKLFEEKPINFDQLKGLQERM